MKFNHLYHLLVEKTENEDYEHKNIKKDNMIEFIDSRSAGAEKIAKEASRKAGVSKLTAAHFKAKLPVYEKIKKAVKNDKSIVFIRKEYRKTLGELRKIRSNQIKFQELCGKLEVLGEILIESKKSSYK